MRSVPDVFSTWQSEHWQLSGRLLHLLCRHGAILYSPNYRKQVRIGWPIPNADDHHVLAIIEPLANGMVKLELRVGEEKANELVGKNGWTASTEAKGKGKSHDQKVFTRLSLYPAAWPSNMKAVVAAALNFCIKKYEL